MTDYFPLGTARGSAFCNRKNELAHLSRNIENAKPTLVISTRRYGKTSLVMRSLELNKSIFTQIDLYKELSEEDVEKAIIDGIGKLLAKVESRPKQLLRMAVDFFADMNIGVVISTLGLSIEIKDRKRKPADVVQKALEKLHEFAEKNKLSFVIFIDEFQRLKEITKNNSIEAAIRHVAQSSSRITFIFSGSNRHLIEAMFFDSKKPFYKMCDTLYLERIATEHYSPFIQHAAKKRWSSLLSTSVIEKILALTENHPYYVNLICSKLWLDKLPTEKMVEECWDKCARENRSQIEKEIDLLSGNQKKLLISLARFGATDTPMGKDFLSHVKMSSTTVSQALSVLLEKDYVYKNNDDFYCVLDPLFKYVLA